ncbi:hypothetical protein GQ457_07G003100 [Hibiscus cannabinus]
MDVDLNYTLANNGIPSEGNPNAPNQNSVPFGLHGGQPPGSGVDLGSVRILERPASPTELEAARASKKGRSDIGLDTSMEVEESVMDGGDSGVAQLSPEHEDEVVVLDEDCLVDESGVFSTIKFSKRVHAQIDKSTQNVIIVRLLGRSIGFGALHNRLNSMWELAGEIQLVDLENNYYLVRFGDPKDYTMALTQGPWTIYGSYLIVQPWSRDFTPMEKHPSHVVVWIRLPGLPYRYYCKALFRRIANVIGRVVKVNYNTKVAKRGKFARLSVLVDLNKPLKSCIGIDNFVQRLEYEGLQNICYGCGVYGHSQEDCTVGRVDPSDERETSRVVGPWLEADGSLSDRFGPWMVAASRRRRYTVPNDVAMGPRTAKGHQSGSRFVALASEDDGTGSEQNLEADRNVGAAEALSDSRVEVEDITRGKRVIQGNGLKFNKAYMVSNPSCLSKSDKRTSVDPKEVAVVSLVEGAIAEGIVREVSAKKGTHVAVTVMDGTQVPKVLDRAGEGSSKHNVRPNRGLRIKQPLGVRSSPRASISNWVTGVMNMIDAEARRMQHGLEQKYEVMDDDDPDEGTSTAEMEDQPGMVPGEGVTTMEDEIAPRNVGEYAIRGYFPHLDFSMLADLSRAVSDEEIRHALFSMSPLKAPGVDGFHAMFFQKNWNTVGAAVCKGIKDIFEDCHVPAELNRTLIVLIPKVLKPCHMSQFRPISLCSVVYKAVTKIIVHRIQPYLSKWVFPNQTSFIPGRSISENIILVQEIIHSMRKKKGVKGWMAIKIDLEKAYDRLEWNFISDTLQDVGLPVSLRRVLMACISTVSSQIVWNVRRLTVRFLVAIGNHFDSLNVGL